MLEILAKHAISNFHFLESEDIVSERVIVTRAMRT
jgi:hypothetical protein